MLVNFITPKRVVIMTRHSTVLLDTCLPLLDRFPIRKYYSIVTLYHLLEGFVGYQSLPDITEAEKYIWLRK